MTSNVVQYQGCSKVRGRDMWLKGQKSPEAVDLLFVTEGRAGTRAICLIFALLMRLLSVKVLDIHIERTGFGT